VQLGGETYRVKFDSKMHATLHGECDSEGKVIRINTLTPDTQVPEIVIHECLHAIFPFLDEEHVDEAAIELTKVLRKLDLLQ
jgi:hypothetical protein